MTEFTEELLATPRLLVTHNKQIGYQSYPIYLEILLLEFSPSGLRMKYNQLNPRNGVSWVDVDYFKLVEILEKEEYNITHKIKVL